MTRKDYVALADALKRQRSGAPGVYEQWLADVYAVAEVLAADNPRFNQTRFLQACGAEVK